MIRRQRPLLAVASGLALAVGGCAAPQELRNTNTLSLGRNSAGDPCTATRTFRDPAITGAFDQSWAINCRNVAASRPLGQVRLFADQADRAAADKALTCGAPGTVAVTGIGEVEARRCYDALLGAKPVGVAA